jgi:hypothetical protein
MLTMMRLVVVAPFILIGLGLCLTFIGIPLGVLLMGLGSKWATAPLMRLPQLNPEGDCD